MKRKVASQNPKAETSLKNEILPVETLVTLHSSLRIAKALIKLHGWFDWSASLFSFLALRPILYSICCEKEIKCEACFSQRV